MDVIIIALAGNALLGLSLVFDKILLEDRVHHHVVSYVFWIGVLNVFGLLFIPFGFEIPPLSIIPTAIAAELALFAGLWFYYLALNRGEASQTLAVVGGFSPIATFLIGTLLLPDELNVAEQAAFVLLAMGGIVMFFAERINFRRVAVFVLLAALSFGFSNVLGKAVLERTDFVTGFVTLKASALLIACGLLLFPALRRKVFSESRGTVPKDRTLYLGNRLLAGAGSVFTVYALKLGHPAIVEAISGFRYVAIFAATLLIAKFWPRILREVFAGWTLAGKVVGTILVVAGLAGLGLQAHYEQRPIPPAEDIAWGVTFSQKMSEEFNLDWRENYRAILSDLRPDGVRLVAYWDRVEPEDDAWDFSDLDWQMNRASEAGVPVVLAVGQKVPRWPECHYPEWIGTRDEKTRKEELLQYLETIVGRYRNHPAVGYWQVENEPFLAFGECPDADKGFFREEVDIVRRIDPKHPVIATDSGEFGKWLEAAEAGDVFGTTMYRKVYNRTFGYITYPLTPEFFGLKKSVVQSLLGDPQKKFVVIELGLEPWGEKQIYETPVEEQLRLFGFEDFKKTVSFARQAKFDTYYLWGAEWWYWLKTKQGNPSFWDEARAVIASGKTSD